MLHFVWLVCLTFDFIRDNNQCQLDSHTHTHTYTRKKYEMCAVFKKTHNGSADWITFFLAHRINHLYFLLKQCTWGKTEVLGELLLFTVSWRCVLHYQWRDSSQPCSDIEGAKKKKGDNEVSRKRQESKNFRGRLCIKHNTVSLQRAMSGVLQFHIQQEQ